MKIGKHKYSWADRAVVLGMAAVIALETAGCGAADISLADGKDEIETGVGKRRAL